jgi:hypothetical protein
MPTLPPERLFLIILLVIWELAWKGIALWRAARSSQRNWFIAILVINSVGILPLVYIYFFSPKSSKK